MPSAFVVLAAPTAVRLVMVVAAWCLAWTMRRIRAADEPRAGAEGEQNLCRRRIEGDDACRCGADTNRITEVVARREGRRTRIPARRDS